ncbi:hypothetical protein DL239_12270 [Sedimentitalea sp. CY04]|uniref:Uncharacterized protein n=1 Tax=Parasedimentitalea denitrificans TaxID=2211118 RepID=A0ABX0W8I9_9RHOB|nr:hypothetical protein [Sedimentitalea sp. CY04]NIZ61746.1 hypothetical protein [Sedimentitalea sp. CY04]
MELETLSKQKDHSPLVDQLRQITPGFLPSDVFDAVARLVVTPTVVFIPLFQRENQTRVVLTRREPDDIHYAGLLHPPGKIMLATDENLDTIFKRLIETELTDLKTYSSPVFVAPFFEQILRGREISLVYYSEIADPGDVMASYDCWDLPADVIATDIPRIESAARAFEQSNGGN